MNWCLYALIVTALTIEPVFADCTIVLKGNVTCEGSNIVVPPPAVPPVVPPVLPPVLEDASPFVFPAQPSWFNPPADARYSYIPGTGDSMTQEGGIYKGLANYPNPLPGGYLYAGRTPDGQSVWVPRGANPVWIRRVLATGHI